MSSTLSVPAFRINPSAAGVLKAAAGFWFTMAFAGQVIFASSTALFYSMTALRGAAGKPVYNFDEDELNTLGYGLVRKKDYKGAIRVFSLNTEAYPKSGNTWDSLGEAYMDSGDRADAIADYRKSLSINPGNQNAREMLEKLGAK